MKTRAAIACQYNQPVVVEQIDLEAPRQREVLVRIAASGICHSDLSVLRGVQPHPLPEVLGHEGAGIVTEVGPGVSSVQPGDHVVLSFVSPCGHCAYCASGRPSLCAVHFGIPRGTLLDGTCRFSSGGQPINQMSRLGTMSEYTVVPDTAVVPIASDIPLDRAALLGCGVTTGVCAVYRTVSVEVGSHVAVVGAGGVGLNVVQGAALAGAERIIAVDILAKKLETARRFGASHTVDASHGDPVDGVRQLTGGVGVHYAFESIGRPETIQQAFHMLRPGGTVVVIGIAPSDAMISLPAALFPYGERRIVGSFYGSARMHLDMPSLLDLYRAGRLKLDELIAKTYTLDQVNEAFEDLERGLDGRGVILFGD